MSHEGNQTENLIARSGLPLIYKVADSRSSPPAARRPEAVRTIVNSLTVFQKEALVTSRRAGETWRFTSDEGKYLMGHDAAPAPLAYLTVGMVASYMNELLALAEMRGISLESVKLVQDNYYSMAGSMMKGTMVAGADHVDLEAVIQSEADQLTLNQLVLDAVAASPLNGLMRGVKESLFTLTHNGREIEPDKALRLDKEAMTRPSQASNPEQARGDWSKLLQRGPMTPPNANTSTGIGGSLADHQNRLLHLRGICTLLEDGTKLIEQQLFNPNGSIFYFRSDESIEDGGHGRAPNAASYISAGIGFCFMTQFGRFAKMNGSKLNSYGIVQDTFFSLGGASGKTGKPGEANSIETHVFLESDEDDEFARHILDVAEKTCFLHAFCRTDLKTKVRVTKAQI